MYCPRCSAKAVEGQQFCRNCGMNLGIILDSIEGKPRGPLDFETLKRDLRDLGASLRSGFEEAGGVAKQTKRLNQQAAGQAAPVVIPDLKRELKKAAKTINAANERTLSLQKATLSIFGGGVVMAAWYNILQAVARPEVVANIERTIMQANPGIPDLNLAVYIPIVKLLWLLGLIPIAKGVAHLINGIFFAPKPDAEPQIIYAQPPMPPAAQPAAMPPPYASAVSTPTNEFDAPAAQPQSVIEDATLRFDPK